MTWLLGLSVVTKLGFDSASLRLIPAAIGRCDWSVLRGFRRFSSRAVVLSTVAAGAAVMVSALLVDDVLATEQGRAFAWALASLPLFAFLELTGARLQALKENVFYQVTYGVIRPLCVVALLVPVGAALGRVDAIAAVLSTLCGTGLVLAICMHRLRAVWPAPSSSAPSATNYRAWSSVTLPLAGIAVSQYLLSRADVLVVGLYVEPELLGAYAVANQAAALVAFGIVASNVVMAPTIAELHARDDRAALQQALRVSQRLVLAYTVPTCLVLVLFGPALLGLFGDNFRSAYGPMLVLAVGQGVIAACGPVGFLLTMTEHQNRALTTIVQFALLQIVLLLLLTPFFGVWGAAAASAAANALRSLVLLVQVRRRLSVSTWAF